MRGFTLIELLVVITILSILATVVLLVINPAQMIKQSRDATRISDMETISKAILVFQSSGTSALSMGSSNTIYVSVPAVNSNCSDLNLSAPPSGWAYGCSTSANNRKTNGTGWIPIDFTSSPFGSLLSTLPIDPTNATSTGLYYTYINGSFALSATLESTKYLASSAANDKGQSSTRFELGSNLALNVNLLVAATAPTSIVLAVGSPAPVGGVTNVAIPSAGATDTTGAVTGWVTTTADKIIFTVTDGGSAVSTITIGGASYTSGANYAIPSTSNLSIIVTTTESDKATGTRTFTVTVAAAPAWTCGDNLTDTRDSKVYTTVTISAQCWMAQNINVGTLTAGVNTQGTDCPSASAIEKYCYSDTESICTSDGALYQWDQAMCGSVTAGATGICPTGWHIPTHDEWTTLERSVCTPGTCATDFPYDVITTGFRGTDEGGKLKETGTTHWTTPNTGATNTSGFTSLPSGYRGTDGFFNVRLEGGYAWSSVESGTSAWARYLGHIDARVYRYTSTKAGGFPVRCLKN